MRLVDLPFHWPCGRRISCPSARRTPEAARLTDDVKKRLIMMMMMMMTTIIITIIIIITLIIIIIIIITVCIQRRSGIAVAALTKFTELSIRHASQHRQPA